MSSGKDQAVRTRSRLQPVSPGTSLTPAWWTLVGEWRWWPGWSILETPPRQPSASSPSTMSSWRILVTTPVDQPVGDRLPYVSMSWKVRKRADFYDATKYWTTQKSNFDNVLELAETVTLNKSLVCFCQKKGPVDLIWRNLCKKFWIYWNKNNIYVTFSGNYSYSSGTFRDLKPF